LSYLDISLISTNLIVNHERPESMHAYLVTFTMILCASCTLAHAEDVFDLSLEELQNIKVNVASLFEDNPLDVASSTAVLYQRDWQNR